MPVQRLIPEHTALLVVDMQEKLMPLMHNAERLVVQAGKMIDVAKALELPVLVTEQYRIGLGTTVQPLADRLDHAVCNHEKFKFSACTAPIRAELERLPSRCVIVCGIEAHVCILQSCLDLADAGYVTAVVCDAIGSRREADQQTAIQRLIQAGIVPITVESAALELVREAGSTHFKAVLPIIR